MRQVAVFALGCFWGPDEFFSKVPGVIETTVGYTGGKKPDPTYMDLGDHTEAVKIEFEPGKISYEKLLELFWDEHDPTALYKIQYMSAIFAMGNEQLAQALVAKQRREKLIEKPIVTRIEPAGPFYKAEEYHQKYLRKNRGVEC